MLSKHSLLPLQGREQASKHRTVSHQEKIKLCVQSPERLRPCRTSVRTLFFPKSGKYRLSIPEMAEKGKSTSFSGKLTEMRDVSVEGLAIFMLSHSLLSSRVYRPSFSLSGPSSFQFINDNQNHSWAERRKKRKTQFLPLQTKTTILYLLGSFIYHSLIHQIFFVLQHELSGKDRSMSMQLCPPPSQKVRNFVFE